jgi:hypothetical protein
MHRGDGSIWKRQTQDANLRRQRARTELGGPKRDSKTHLNLEVQEVQPRQLKVHLAGRIGLDEHSAEDQGRRSYLHRGERDELIDFVRIEGEVRTGGSPRLARSSLRCGGDTDLRPEQGSYGVFT